MRALLIAAVAHTHTGSWAGGSARLRAAATAGPSSPSRRQALTTTNTTTITKHRTMIERAACPPAHSCTGCWAGGFVCHRSAAFTGWSSSAKGRTLTTMFTHTTKPCGTMLQQSTHSALHRALCMASCAVHESMAMFEWVYTKLGLPSSETHAAPEPAAARALQLTLASRARDRCEFNIYGEASRGTVAEQSPIRCAENAHRRWPSVGHCATGETSTTAARAACVRAASQSEHAARWRDSMLVCYGRDALGEEEEQCKARGSTHEIKLKLPLIIPATLGMAPSLVVCWDCAYLLLARSRVELALSIELYTKIEHARSAERSEPRHDGLAN